MGVRTLTESHGSRCDECQDHENHNQPDPPWIHENSLPSSVAVSVTRRTGRAPGSSEAPHPVSNGFHLQNGGQIGNGEGPSSSRMGVAAENARIMSTTISQIFFGFMRDLPLWRFLGQRPHKLRLASLTALDKRAPHLTIWNGFRNMGDTELATGHHYSDARESLQRMPG